MRALSGAGVPQRPTAAHGAGREPAEAEAVGGDFHQNCQGNRLRPARERVAVLLQKLLHVLGPAVVDERVTRAAKQVVGGLRRRVRAQRVLLGLVGGEGQLVAPGQQQRGLGVEAALRRGRGT